MSDSISTIGKITHRLPPYESVRNNHDLFTQWEFNSSMQIGGFAPLIADVINEKTIIPVFELNKLARESISEFSIRLPIVEKKRDVWIAQNWKSFSAVMLLWMH